MASSSPGMRSGARRVGSASRVALLLVLCSLVACSGDKVTGRRGSALPAAALSGFTYVVPVPMPPGRPGDVIATSDVGPDARIAGADRRVVVYHSTSVTGRDIAVSGVVFVPPGPAPRRRLAGGVVGTRNDGNGRPVCALGAPRTSITTSTRKLFARS